MINNNPLEYIEQTVAVEDLLIAGVSRKLRNDIGYDLVYLSSPNDFELTTGATGSGLKFIGGTTHRLPIQSDWTQLTFISSVANQIVYVVYAELTTYQPVELSTDSRNYVSRIGFLNTDALTTGTFTRAATTNGAYYYNSVGLLTTAGTNVPRFDYNPLTLESKGLLLEQTATEYITRTETFSNWTGVGITATDNTLETLSPTGQYNASKMEYTSASANRYLLSPGGGAHGSTLDAGSIYVKKGNFTNFGFELNNWDIASSTILKGTCNLDTGLITYTTGTGSTNIAEQLSNGWWRVGFSTSVGGVSTSRCALLPGAKSVGETVGNYCYVFGANVTNTPVVQSYIKNETGSTTVNRPTDVYTISTSSFGFSTSLGTIYLSFDGNIFDGNSQTSSRRPLVLLPPNEYFFINDTSGNPVYSGKSRDSASNVLFWNNPDPVNNKLANRVLNAALSFNTQVGLFTGVINNGTAARQTFAGFTTAGAHVYTFNNQAFQGHIREFKWFGFAFTDAQLGDLTK
jgi:hypothetical protein